MISTRFPVIPVKFNQQRGAVLAVGLILLLVMTLVMIVAMSGSILQERMAGAMRSESMSEVGVESALRDGEVWVWNNIVARGEQLFGSTTAFPYDARVSDGADPPRSSPGPAENFRSSIEWRAEGNEFGSAGTGVSFDNDPYYRMARIPRYMVETLQEGGSGSLEAPESHEGLGGVTLKESRHYYRITGRSTGGTEGVVRGAESTFSISLFEN